MLAGRDIPVIFRPLQNLLGAYIDDPDQGVMVTTKRQLRVQRFTAAHELGHAALAHKASLDLEEVIQGALFKPGFDPREVQANAFATELLTPQWLIAEHMRRQKWTRADLLDPLIVYQLSLRMGSSYAATCYALTECKAINSLQCERLLAMPRREIKRTILSPFEPANYYGDVWLVTERDNGMILEGSRTDLVVIKTEEHANAGYLWQFGDLSSAGLEIRSDARAGTPDHVGGIVYRTVIAEASGIVSGHLNLREVRPWQKGAEPLNSLEMEVDLYGPVAAGLLPLQREAALQEAA
jgi:Zn-dependent peptidase ImmA (M78 family)